MKVYTRTGDKGTTGLWGGGRVSKGNLQVECYGTVDEANSWLGFAVACVQNPEVKKLLPLLQGKLQTLASEVASSTTGLQKLRKHINSSDITELESHIDGLSEKLPKGEGFVLPGGSVGAGTLDVARTVVRRAERLVVRWQQQHPLRDEVVQFLNRLSDLLFVMARVETEENLVQEVTRKVRERLEPSFAEANLSIAKKLIAAAQAKAGELDLDVVVSVVDKNGYLIALERQDHALLGSIDIAWGKAYTAALLQMPTHEVAEYAQPGRELYGIENSNGGRLVIFGGGLPLIKGGSLWGAVGVSGGTVEQDMEVAQAALDFWQTYLAGHPL